MSDIAFLVFLYLAYKTGLMGLVTWFCGGLVVLGLICWVVQKVQSDAADRRALDKQFAETDRKLKRHEATQRKLKSYHAECDRCFAARLPYPAWKGWQD